MRKKVVTYDGASFTISPLNLDQVDEMVAKPQTDVLEILCSALNNAGPATPYTQVQLRKELDPILRQQLLDDVLSYSGLAQDGGTLRSNQPGEAAAASVN